MTKNIQILKGPGGETSYFDSKVHTGKKKGRTDNKLLGEGKNVVRGK